MQVAFTPALLSKQAAYQWKRRTCAPCQAAPSGASAVATTPGASVGCPFRRIIILGAPVKNIMLTTNKRLNYFTTLPLLQENAADDGNAAIAAIGVVHNEREGGCCQVP